jgi:hypothetical protein
VFEPEESRAVHELVDHPRWDEVFCLHG